MAAQTYEAFEKNELGDILIVGFAIASEIEELQQDLQAQRQSMVNMVTEGYPRVVKYGSTHEMPAHISQGLAMSAVRATLVEAKIASLNDQLSLLNNGINNDYRERVISIKSTTFGLQIDGNSVIESYDKSGRVAPKLMQSVEGIFSEVNLQEGYMIVLPINVEGITVDHYRIQPINPEDNELTVDIQVLSV